MQRYSQVWGSIFEPLKTTPSDAEVSLRILVFLDLDSGVLEF